MALKNLIGFASLAVKLSRPVSSQKSGVLARRRPPPHHSSVNTSTTDIVIWNQTKGGDSRICNLASTNGVKLSIGVCIGGCELSIVIVGSSFAMLQEASMLACLAVDRSYRHARKIFLMLRSIYTYSGRWSVHADYGPRIRQKSNLSIRRPVRIDYVLSG